MNRFLTATLLLFWSGYLSLQAAEDIIPAYVPPAEPTIATMEMPEMHHTTLANGLHITTILQQEIPTVSFTLSLNGGALQDPADKEGTASLTASLLDRGTSNRSGDQIAAELDFIATSIHGWSDWYRTYVSFSCLTRYLDESLELFGDVLLHPVFPAAELENTRVRRLSSLRQGLDSPRRQVRRNFNLAVYAGSRYALPAGGDLESLTRITQADVVDFYNNFYTPVGAELIIVGDVDHQEMVKLVERQLGMWLVGGTPAVTDTPAPLSREPGIILVHKPSATNATFRFGQLGLPRNHPDYHALQVMNYILGGGGFSSRLMLKIRNELGYTYGIYSNFDYERETGSFSVGAAVTASHLEDAIRESLTIIEAMRLELVTELELRDARNYLAASYLLNFENPENLAAEIADAHVYGLPESDITDYSERILAVTRDDVLRLAATHITPDNFHYVACGDSALLLEQLERLGTVTIVEID